jgi:hypothetical protein
MEEKMRRFKEVIEDFVGEVFALAIGWLVGITVLGGAYAIGRWAAPHLGWSGNNDVFGLLSALTFLWLYEHQNLEGKYDRLRELLDRRGPGISN